MLLTPSTVQRFAFDWLPLTDMSTCESSPVPRVENAPPAPACVTGEPPGTSGTSRALVSRPSTNKSSNAFNKGFLVMDASPRFRVFPSPVSAVGWSFPIHALPDVARSGSANGLVPKISLATEEGHSTPKRPATVLLKEGETKNLLRLRTLAGGFVANPVKGI